MEKAKILFLAANPSRDLRLDEEIREIATKIRAAKHRDALELVSCWAVRRDDLQQALLEHQPHVLHFSGHGNPSDEIILLDDNSNPDPVSQQTLVDLLRTLKDNLKLVVLNACFSQPQAEAISTVVDCTIGMNKAVGDEAAIKFAAAFYRALGFGRSVQTAFELGLNSLTMKGARKQQASEELDRKLLLPGGEEADLQSADQIPHLISRQNVDASRVFLVGASQPGDDLTDPSLEKLRSARERVKQLMKGGAEQAEIDAAKAEVLAARREVREGSRLRPGDVLLDRYELIECIGSGGFATVWKCFDEETTTIVAAKILHPSHREERKRIDRFFRGARAMKQLSHESIVRVLEERCSDEGYHFYIMEFVDGNDFQESILSGNIARDSVLEIILAAAEALHFAHTTLPDLVHRDIKPSNILLTSSGQVRVTDFDLVRTANTTGGTRTGSLGTFIYTAPESLQKASEVDARADVFSLGMTAIFGLYGQELPPAAFRHADKFIESLDCNRGIKDVLTRAVDWEQSERLASMQDFASGIREALKKQEAPSRSASPKGKTARKRKSTESATNTRQKGKSPLKLEGDVVTNSIGMQLRLIPEGSFLMGSPDADATARSEERPQHPVRLTQPFYLGVYAVTQEQYEKVMGSRPWQGEKYVKDGPDYPATHVSWHDAIEFCRKLSEQEGVEYDLPTEAQWEYACRAVTTTVYNFGDDASALGEHAWYRQNAWELGEKYAHPVGQKKPNPWDLYDMHGNIWEWCKDWFGSYKESADDDPTGPPSGDSRVLRGGSFDNETGDCRSAFRTYWLPDDRYGDIGFRVSRTYN